MPPAATDPRLARLRRLLRAGADPAHAARHRAYHKCSLRFHGLRAPALRTALREAFPARPRATREEQLPLVRALWASPFLEERATAVALLGRVARELGPADLPWLRSLTRDCEGWALLDALAIEVLGPLALVRGEPVYRGVKRWHRDPWPWTRRASVLVHVVPARRGALAHDFAWPTFEALLPDRGFFLRKAVGWALREACRHYPKEVHDFLARAGQQASGLTFREGSRRLPPELRARLAREGR